MLNTDSDLHQICTHGTSKGHLVGNCGGFSMTENDANDRLTLAGSAMVREADED